MSRMWAKKSRFNIFYRTPSFLREMILSHLYGAMGIRVRRFYLKKSGIPDVSSVDENLWVGGTSSIQSIAKHNIRNILDLRKEARDDPEDIGKHSIDYLNIRIADGDPPTPAQAVRAIKWIKQRRSEGTLVHCNLGRGRAPSVAALYLVYDGASADDAIKIVKRQRRFSYFNRVQLAAIYDFEKMKKSGRI